MKREIIEVTIIANVRPRLRSRCIEVQRKHDPIPQTYPLTERNYWRAVGMQLRLAGFAKQVDTPPHSQ